MLLEKKMLTQSKPELQAYGKFPVFMHPRSSDNSGQMYLPLRYIHSEVKCSLTDTLRTSKDEF